MVDAAGPRVAVHRRVALALFDDNVAPFFQSFVEVRVEPSAHRVRVIPRRCTAAGRGATSYSLKRQRPGPLRTGLRRMVRCRDSAAALSRKEICLIARMISTPTRTK